MHSEGYSSWVVCLSVTQHLTSRMFFRFTNDTTYLTGNEGQKFCGDFPETSACEKVNMYNLTGLICSLCVPWGVRKSQRIAHIDSRMLSTYCS